jgi:hypothetical protein
MRLFMLAETLFVVQASERFRRFLQQAPTTFSRLDQNKVVLTGNDQLFLCSWCS